MLSFSIITLQVVRISLSFSIITLQVVRISHSDGWGLTLGPSLCLLLLSGLPDTVASQVCQIVPMCPLRCNVLRCFKQYRYIYGQRNYLA